MDMDGDEMKDPMVETGETEETMPAEEAPVAPKEDETEEGEETAPETGLEDEAE